MGRQAVLLTDGGFNMFGLWSHLQGMRCWKRQINRLIYTMSPGMGGASRRWDGDMDVKLRWGNLSEMELTVSEIALWGFIFLGLFFFFHVASSRSGALWCQDEFRCRAFSPLPWTLSANHTGIVQDYLLTFVASKFYFVQDAHLDTCSCSSSSSRVPWRTLFCSTVYLMAQNNDKARVYLSSWSYTCSPCVRVGFLLVLRIPPTPKSMPVDRSVSLSCP